jgi:hypothetical protein
MIKFGLSGRYRLERYRHGVLQEQTPWFDNLITDAGLNSFGVGFPSAALVYLGTGSSSPTAADTGLSGTLLASRSGGSTSWSASTDSDPPFHRAITVTTFAIGEVIGTVAEIGIGYGGGITLLFSRSLVRDIDGNMTAITFTAVDQAIVYYELRQYFSLDDIETSITINETEHAVILRPAFVESLDHWKPVFSARIRANHMVAYTGDIGTVYLGPSGTALSSAQIIEEPYVAGSLRRGASTYWHPGTGSGTFMSFRMAFTYPGSSYAGTYQFSIDPTITKSDRQTLRMDFECTWARHTPET